MALEFAALRVAGVETLCDDAAAVTFDVPDELRATFRFRAGQSLTVRRRHGGNDDRRSYSICAAAGAPVRIGVRAVAGGAVSGWLVHDVRPGDMVEVAPPSGSFTTDLDVPARHVMIGAGSGITPLLSIAATALRTPGSTVTVLYGNRRSDSVMFADELAELKDRFGPRLEIVHVLSREQRDAGPAGGRLDSSRLDSLLTELVPVAAVRHWWLCGPYGLVETARDVLTARGVPADRVHRELFYVEDVAPPPATHPDAVSSGPTSAVTILLDGRAGVLALPRDTPILDAAQRVRGDLPFACKGGVCGTCRARVTAGEVTMRRNFALEDDELADGFVLSCQSLPVTDEVTLDFDA